MIITFIFIIVITFFFKKKIFSFLISFGQYYYNLF